jgi:HEAT repeat protein
MQVETNWGSLQHHDSELFSGSTLSGLSLSQDKELVEKNQIISGFLRCIKGKHLSIRSENIDRLLKYPDISNDVLVLALLSDNPQARAMAAFALGISRNPKTATILIQAYNDPDESVRAWVVKALGECGSPSGYQTLLEALCDESEVVRAEAAYSLGSTKEKRAIPHLISVASIDTNEKVRIWAGQSVIQIEEARKHHNSGKEIEPKEFAWIRDSLQYPYIIAPAPAESSLLIIPDSRKKSGEDDSPIHSILPIPVNYSGMVGNCSPGCEQTENGIDNPSYAATNPEEVPLICCDPPFLLLPSPDSEDRAQEELPVTSPAESYPQNLDTESGTVEEEVPGVSQESTKLSIPSTRNLLSYIGTDAVFHETMEMVSDEAHGIITVPILNQEDDDSIITVDILDDQPEELRIITSASKKGQMGEPFKDRQSWVMNALIDSDASIRALGASVAAREGNHVSIGMILSLVRDEDTMVRGIVYSSLAAVRDPLLIPAIATALSPRTDIQDEKNVSYLIQSLHRILKDPSEDLQVWGAWALGHLGEEAIQDLAIAVNNGTWNVQKEALEGLMRIGAPSASTLVSLLGHPSEKVRYKVAGILSQMNSEALPLLIEAEGAEELHTHILASWLLRCAGDQGIDAYIRALGSESAQVRDRAMEVLVSLGPSALDHLAVLAINDNPQVRLGILQTLICINDSRAQDLLSGFVSDTEETIRLLALNVISYDINDQMSPYFIRALSDPSENVRLAGVIALGKRKDPHTIIHLLKRLKDPSERVRNETIQSLAEIGECLSESCEG